MEISIRALRSAHNLSAFSSGVAALDAWIRQTARQHIRKGISRTYVAVEAGNPGSVPGYYSLTAGEAHANTLPSDLARKLPNRLPVVLIGRLAVASTMHGKGIGKVLLIDALQRIVRTSAEIGIAAILVDAKDEQAAHFYEHFGFQRLPDDTARLILPVSTAKAAVG